MWRVWLSAVSLKALVSVCVSGIGVLHVAQVNGGFLFSLYMQVTFGSTELIKLGTVRVSVKS